MADRVERRVLQGRLLSGLVSTRAETAPSPGSRAGGLRSRSQNYLDLAARLDAGQLHDHGALEAFLADLREELGTLALPSTPMGLVGRCYLGPPYQAHVLDLAGGIVEHYEQGVAMPGTFERARALVLHPAYVLVEVHPEHLVAIREDGTATTV